MTQQPIETAPKGTDAIGDRINILLFFPPWGWIRGYWENEQYAKKPAPYWRCDQAHLWGLRRVRSNQPTHWMPLPPPPTKGTT